MAANREVIRLGKRLREIERQLKAQNVPQLGNSSIQNGSLRIYDEDGNEAARIGKQEDGSFAPVTVVGPPPPAPSAPTVTTKNVGAVAVTWDGAYVDGAVPPLDFLRAEVHITTEPDTEPDTEQASTTRFGSIADAAGGTATIKLDAGTWYIRLVVRTHADQTSAPSEAVDVQVSSVLDRDDIVDVIEQAGTGNRVFYATTPPSQDGTREGDTWRQREPFPGTNIVAEWAWDGETWVPQQLTSEVITSLDVGKLTAGYLQAAVGIGTAGFIVAGDPEGANASMTADGFRASAVTEEGEQYTSTRLGTGADDALEIIGAPNEPPVASVSSVGDISGQSITSAGDVQVSGVPILGQTFDPAGPVGYLDAMPHGLTRQADMKASAAGTWPVNVNSVVGWFTFKAYAGRMYRFEMPFDGTSYAVGSPNAIRTTARVYQTVAPSPDASAPEPTASSTLMTEWSQYQPPINSAVSDVLAFTWQPWGKGQTEAEPREVALAVSVFPNFATFAATTTRAATWTATVSDIGPADESKMVFGSAAGAAGQRRYVTTWTASNSRAYLNSGAMITSDPTVAMRQGQNTAAPKGQQTHSLMTFTGTASSGDEAGKTIANALAGAVLSKVEVWVFAAWWGDTKDNRIYLQRYPGSEPPATFTGNVQSGNNRWTFPYGGAGVGQWMTIPSNWITTENRGIEIGPLDALAASVLGTSGRFAGANHPTVSRRPQLRLTYTKAG